MVDLARQDTIQHAKNYIDDEIAPIVENERVKCIVVAGNKMDLKEQIVVSDADLEDLAEYARDRMPRKRVYWMKTSAKIMQSLEQLFNSLLECILS